MYQLRTVRGYDFYEVASALQKSIRRGDVKLAGYFALELFESNFDNYCWKRLLTVSAEDVADFVTQEIKALYDSYQIINKGSKEKKGRIFICKAVIVLCTARKCRDADVLSNYVYDKKKMIPDDEIEKVMYEARTHREDVPEYTFDIHTKKGKAAGKTKDQFFQEEHGALSPRIPGLFDSLVE